MNTALWGLPAIAGVEGDGETAMEQSILARGSRVWRGAGVEKSRRNIWQALQDRNDFWP